jgi:hypothetical protein
MSSISYQSIKSNQLFLNSSQASSYNNGTYKSDLSYDLNNIIQLDRNTIEVKLSLVNAQIPYSFYQINSTNNKLNVTINSVTTSYYLTKGNYNVNTFITMLDAIIAPNFTTTYSAITNQFTFTNSVDNFSFSDDLYSCFGILGFISETIYTSVGFSLQSAYCFNLSPLTRINIGTSSIILKNSDSYNKSLCNTIATIPISTLPGGIIFYNNLNNFRINVTNPTQINDLNIQIYDDNRNLINFNNIDWSLTFQIDVVSENIISTHSMEEIYEAEEQQL